MKADFTEQQKKDGINQLEIDDVFFEAQTIEGSGVSYKLTGKATIDGEVFHGVVLEFETITAPKGSTIEEIMHLEWDTYDFLVDLKNM